MLIVFVKTIWRSGFVDYDYKSTTVHLVYAMMEVGHCQEQTST